MDRTGAILAIVLAITLLVSGAQKLRTLGSFELTVRAFDVLPPWASRLYARTVPALELALAGALLFGLYPTVAATTVILLLCSFLYGVGLNLLQGRRLTCHCFGATSAEKIGPITIVRLALLLGCAGAVVLWPPVGSTSVSSLPTMLIALGGLVGLYLLPVVPDAWALWHQPPPRSEAVRTRRISLRHVPPARDSDPRLVLPVAGQVSGGGSSD